MKRGPKKDLMYREVNGCWEVSSHKPNDSGYPRLTYNDKLQGANRVAYQYAKGPIPEGMYILHSCNNRICINPEHLRIGTHAENMRDKALAGSQKGEKNTSHKLTEKQVREIRASTEPQWFLGKRYNVSFQLVSKIKSNKAWSWLE